ncbi:MAG: hypothetical protein ACLR5P_07460 [[Eubacterium] siraeum]
MKVPVPGLTYSDVALVDVPVNVYEPLYFVPLTVIYFPSAFLMRKYICLFLSTLLLGGYGITVGVYPSFYNLARTVFLVFLKVTVPVPPAVTVTV